MTVPDKPTDRANPGVWRRYRYYVIVPMVAIVVLWLLLIFLTENQNIAPFIYATN